MPGTVSAQRAKESWRGKQEMRDFRKFKPFFVQVQYSTVQWIEKGTLQYSIVQWNENGAA